MTDRSTSVLYDAPGPRARRNAAIGSLVAGAVLLIVLWVVYRRLADQDQFSAERWGPLLNPGDETFQAVWRLLGSGLRATLVAAALAIACSMVLGTVLAAGRMLTGRWGRIPLVGLIELLRGLPVVITIYLAYRVLPDLGVNVAPLPGEDGLWYLIIGLTAYNMVVIAEIIRAGVASLPRGQREAALAVGMGHGQAMRLVLLPQAFRVMLPALISQLVVILKDTSLAGLLGLYPELLKSGRDVVQELNNPLQTYFVIAVIFILINGALSRLAVLTERRLSRNRRAAAPTAPAEHAEAAAAGTPA